MKKLLVYIGASLTIIWGISHILPTHNIVKGFGNISTDNINIIKMEWVNEGFTLIFIGVLNILVTVLGSSNNRVIKGVYVLTFIMLVVMSLWSLNTGFKIDFLPYKLCPFIFTTSGLLILQGASIAEK
jgi:lipopolysaccharide export LptBFGC system permease protein LptF